MWVHEYEVDFHEKELRALPADLFNIILQFMSKDERINNEKVKNRQIKKLTNLTNSKTINTSLTIWRKQNLPLNAPSDWERSKVMNLSSYNPTNEEIKILSLGFNFSLRPSQEQKSRLKEGVWVRPWLKFIHQWTIYLLNTLFDDHGFFPTGVFLSIVFVYFCKTEHLFINSETTKLLSFIFFSFLPFFLFFPFFCFFSFYQIISHWQFSSL